MLMTRTACSLVGALAAIVAIANPIHAVVPGKNGKIAFSSNRSGNFEIWTVDANGTELTNLTNNPASDRGPSWSPDGQRIAFHSTRAGNTRISRYFVKGPRASLARLKLAAEALKR